MVELLNEPFGDMHRVDVNGVLYGNIHLRAGGLEVPRQSGKTVQRLSIEFSPEIATLNVRSC